MRAQSESEVRKWAGVSLAFRSKSQSAPRCPPDGGWTRAAYLGETGLLSQGVQEGRQALRILHIHSMEVHRKRPRGFK